MGDALAKKGVQLLAMEEEAGPSRSQRRSRREEEGRAEARSEEEGRAGSAASQTCPSATRHRNRASPQRPGSHFIALPPNVT